MKIFGKHAGVAYNNDNERVDLDWRDDGQLQFRKITVTFDCSDPDSDPATVTVSGAIPANFVVLGSSVAVTEDIATVQTIDIGTTGDLDCFVDAGTGVTAGSTYTLEGAANAVPFLNETEDAAVLTSVISGQDFSSGTVELTVFGYQTAAPSTRVR